MMARLRLDIYFVSFPSDPRRIKALVYGVYLIEIAQTAVATHDAFGVFGSGWGSIKMVIDVQLGWLAVPVITGFGALTPLAFSSAES